MECKKEKVFQFIDEHREEMVNLWQEVVDMKSGPHEKAGIDVVGKRFQSVLNDLGAATRQVEFEQAGNMLIGELGTDRAKAGVLFMGHMDTACPAETVVGRNFTIRDGIAYGPGVLDMKGGIVAALYAVKALQHIGYETRPIKFVLAGDEEVLHARSTAADTFVEEAKGFAAAFNVETGFKDNGIVVGRKGVMRLMMQTRGVAAHAGNDPENGRNAIEELAHKLLAVQRLTDWEKGISFNVGVIEGGTTSTTVPEMATIYIDVRYKDPEDYPAIMASVEAIAAQTFIEGTTTTVRFMEGIKPMKTTEGVNALFEVVKAASAECGFDEPYAKYVGGASDSAYSVIAGVPTVCAMGVKGARNHSPEEHAVVDTLFERAKLLAACVLKLDEQ